MSVDRVPAQPVNATQALNLSAGVSNCKVSRGRSWAAIRARNLPISRRALWRSCPDGRWRAVA